MYWYRMQNVFIETLIFCLLFIFIMILMTRNTPYVDNRFTNENEIDNLITSDIVTNQSQSIDAGRIRVVPSLVHVIWFYPYNTSFRFHHLMCLLSIRKHINPDRLMFWHNHIPTGGWWRFAKESIPSIYMMYREPPRQIFSHPVILPEHQSDIARIDILQKFGGIYIDLDVLIVNSFDHLLHYPMTMGAESPFLLGSGIILSEKNASFLSLWKQQYVTFNDAEWNRHSVEIPMQIARQNPDSIHIEWFSLQRPNWDERHWLYTEGKLWNWQQDNIAVHLWYREYNVDHDPHSIRMWNTTAGELFRFIYYGNSRLQHT